MDQGDLAWLPGNVCGNKCFMDQGNFGWLPFQLQNPAYQGKELGVRLLEAYTPLGNVRRNAFLIDHSQKINNFIYVCDFWYEIDHACRVCIDPHLFKLSSSSWWCLNSLLAADGSFFS